MAYKSGTPRGNCFYTSVPMRNRIERLDGTRASPFLRMRKAEQIINAVVRSAGGSNIMAFPVMRALRSRKSPARAISSADEERAHAPERR